MEDSLKQPRTKWLTKTRFTALVVGAVVIVVGVFLIRVALVKQLTVPIVTGDMKVDRLIAAMTLDEKISLLHGATEATSTNQGQAGYLPGIPRLGIPSLRLADGPPGVLTQYPSTGLTATMGLAATFSSPDAQQNGVVIGRDAKALGQNVTLQPFINMDRDPTWTRGYNTFGEDPLLTGQIGAAEITGIQSQGTMAQAKHFIAYDGANDVTVNQQALHEIYLQPFQDAVDAGVSSIMCSYNKINGAQSCGNTDTLNTILRGELGFKGFVTSDWGANHSSASLNNGVDLEMPGTKLIGPDGTVFALPYFVQSAIMAALKNGTIKEATINLAVGRLLYEYDRFGLLNGKSKHIITAVPVAADASIVQKTGEDAAVLLKNDDNALPLTNTDLHSLTLIGPGAGQIVSYGVSGEKALGIPSRYVSPLIALKQDTSNVANRNITYAVADDMMGVPIPASALSINGKPGLLRTTNGTKATQLDPQVNFTVMAGNVLPAGASSTWTGMLNVPHAGSYWLALQILGASGQLLLDGKSIGDTGSLYLHGNILQPGQNSVLPTTDNLDNVRSQVSLTAGSHRITITTTGDSSGKPVQVRLAWMTPEQQQANDAAAIAAARTSSKVVFFAWSQGTLDKPLPEGQDKLIEEIAARNPNIIVVLNTSQPVAMPWLSKVKAVLEMWYPGQEGGWATADVLLGKANPAGRLPFTWPQTLDQGVANVPSHPERSSLGVGCTICTGPQANGKTTYSEGIFIGYRWYDQQKLTPLYPFGYGLSYTKFDYSHLGVRLAKDRGLDVSFHIQNVGLRSGDEVPQVYLGMPDKRPTGVQFAVNALAGYQRITLAVGQGEDITIHVPLRQLQYWLTTANRWITATGMRSIFVGTSSRDFRLQGTIS